MPTLRPATIADIPAMLNLERLAPSAGHWSAAQYQAVFSADGCRLALIVEDHVDVNGFLVAHEIGGEWELENLVVAASVRRRGLASQLVAGLIENLRVKAAAALFLEVRESNHAARLLYEKVGFTEMGRRPRYYSDPKEDAVQYQLRITAKKS